MIRKAAVAGRFYPQERPQLLTELRECIPANKQKLEAKAIVVPHAGYRYSGHVAGSTYARIQLPRHFVILCPNHTGLGAPISIMSEGQWETPLGLCQIDSALAHAIRQEYQCVQENRLAHRREHALEVHLPFLQLFLGSDFQFVPITVGTRRLDSLKELGAAIGKAIKNSGEDVLLIASTDMNHFEPEDSTRQKDQLAIERILELDSDGLYETVHREHISMCGYGPTVAVMEAARQLGASHGELIEYTHSGEVTGDRTSVVGYAGLVIH